MSLYSSDCAICLASIIVLLTGVLFFLSKRGLPPGPWGLPYAGYWPFLKASTCHLQLKQMTERYGDISCFSVFGYVYINMGSVKAAREFVISRSECFEARINDFSLLRNTFDDSVAFINGEEWKILRKMFLQKLKERNFNSFKEEKCSPIYEAVRASVQDLRNTHGRATDIIDILNRRCRQTLRHALFGEASNVSDPQLAEICKSYDIILENMTGTNLLLVGNFAKYFILPFTHGYKEANEHLALALRRIQDMVKEHKSTYDESNMRDIIDVYIKERNDRSSKNDPTARFFSDQALIGSLFQFIGDGINTVAVYVSAIFRALLDHPEEQEKIYRELQEVVGSGREPSIEDKSRLPYTNAFVMEVERTCDIFPFFPQLECTKETTVQGHRIPKGCLLLLNSWAAHHDPKEYEDPDTFNPSRFIVQQGRKRPEAPILFGMGKRVCMGEGFATAQAFLFLATIVKHFRLTRPAGRREKLLFLTGNLDICAHPRDT